MSITFLKPKDSQFFPKNAKEKVAIREERWRLDGGQCIDCKRPVILERGFWGSMHLMHLKGKGAGGDWSMDNLATGCPECHTKRHNAGGKPVPAKERTA